MNKEQLFAPDDDDMITMHSTIGSEGGSGVTRIPRAEYERRCRNARRRERAERRRKLATYDAWEDLKAYLDPGEHVQAVRMNGRVLSLPYARRKMRGKSLSDAEFAIEMTVWTDRSIIDVWVDKEEDRDGYETGEKIIEVHKCPRKPK